jgi:hypothetical protein
MSIGVAVLMIVLGFLAVALPLATGIGISILVGWIIVFSGFAYLAYAFAAKGAGVVRIGVVKINDSSGEYLPVDNLRVNLMSEVTLRQMEAVPLDADSAPAITAEAADKQCDYILYTNAAQVKGPGSGGITLPAAVRGMSLSQDKYQALLDTKLNRVHAGITLAEGPDPRLEEQIVADADQFGVNAVMAGFEKEANKVAEQVQKDRQPARPSRTTPAKKPATAKKPG